MTCEGISDGRFDQGASSSYLNASVMASLLPAERLKWEVYYLFVGTVHLHSDLYSTTGEVIALPRSISATTGGEYYSGRLLYNSACNSCGVNDRWSGLP